MTAAETSSSDPEQQPPVRQLPEPPVRRSAPLRMPILVGVLLPLIILPFAVFTAFCIWVFETGLLPEYDRKAWTSGTGVKRDVEYALQIGIPLRQLRGMNVFLDNTKDTSDTISFIAITESTGVLLYTSSDAPPALGTIIRRAEQRADDNPADLRAAQMSAISLTVARFYEQIMGETIILDEERVSVRIDDHYVTSLDIRHNDEVVAQIHVGVGVAVLNRVVADLIFDTATVFLSALVIAIEFLILILTVHLLRPLTILRHLADQLRNRDFTNTVDVDSRGVVSRVADLVNQFIVKSAERLENVRRLVGMLPHAQKDPKFAEDYDALSQRYKVGDQGSVSSLRLPALTYVRLPLFLFFLSEALLRPILPLVIGDLDRSGLALSTEAAIGLPFSAFMFTSILGVVIGSLAAERSGSRTVFLVGAVLAALALLAQGFISDVLQMTVARSVSGIGYGLVYAAAQVYVVKNSDRKRRASGFSVFLSSVVAAEICGPAIGGIISDRIGTTPTFTIGGMILLLSAIISMRFLGEAQSGSKDKASVSEKSGQALKDFGSTCWILFKSHRFLVLTLFFAIPSKLLLTGAIFFLVPLAGASLGATSAEIGRVLTIYGLAVLFAGPLCAQFADRWKAFGFMVGLGGFISGAGLILVGLEPSMFALSIAVLGIGVGQAMSIPSQLTFTLDVAEREVQRVGAGPVLGVFRLIERIGSLFGPIMATILLANFSGAPMALLIMGVYAIMSAAIASAYFLMIGVRSEEVEVEELYERVGQE